MSNNNLPANNDDDRIVQLSGEDADPSDVVNVSLNQTASLLPVPATSLVSLATAGPDDFASFFTLRNKNKKPDRWKDMARNRVYCVDWCSIKCNQATHFVKMTAGPIGIRNTKVFDDRGFGHYCLDTKDVVPVLNIPVTLWNKCYSLLNPITLSLTLANFAKPPYVWVTIPGPCIYVPFLFWKGNEDINFMVSAIPPLLRNVAWMCTNLNSYWNTQTLTKDCTLTCLFGGEFTIYDSGQDAKPIPYDMVTGLIGPDVGAMLHNIIGVAGNFFPGGAKGLLMQAGAGILDSVVSGFENAGEGEGFSLQAFGQGVLMTGLGMVMGAGSSKLTSKFTSMKAVTKWLSGPTMQKWSGRLNRLSNMTNPVQIGHDQIISFRSHRLPPDVRNAAVNAIAQAEATNPSPRRVISREDLCLEYGVRRLYGQGDRRARWMSRLDQIFDTGLGVASEQHNKDNNRIWQVSKAIIEKGGKTPNDRAHLVNAINDKEGALNKINETQDKIDKVETEGETVRHREECLTEKADILQRHEPNPPKTPTPDPDKQTFSESSELIQRRASADSAHSSLERDLGKQHESISERLDTDYKRNSDQLDTDFERNSKKLNDDYDADIQRLQEDYNRKANEDGCDINQLNEQFNRDVEERSNQHNRDSERLSRDYENDNNKLTDDYNRDKQQLKEDYDREKGKIDEDYQNEKAKIEEDSAKEKAAWEKQQEVNRRKYQEEQEAKRRWQEDKDRIKELNKQMDDDDKEIARQRAELERELTEQMETYNNAIKIISNQEGFNLPHTDTSTRDKILNFLTQEGKDDAAVGITNLLLMVDTNTLSNGIAEMVIKWLWSKIKDKEGEPDTQ